MMPVASVVPVKVPESVPPPGFELMVRVMGIAGTAAPVLSVACTCTGGEMATPGAVFVGCVTKVRKATGGTGTTTFSVIVLLALCIGEELSATAAVKLNVPVAVGMPLSTPLLLKFRPSMFATGVQL